MIIKLGEGFGGVFGGKKGILRLNLNVSLPLRQNLPQCELWQILARSRQKPKAFGGSAIRKQICITSIFCSIKPRLGLIQVLPRTLMKD
jgi:hypothetical protein